MTEDNTAVPLSIPAPLALRLGALVEHHQTGFHQGHSGPSAYLTDIYAAGQMHLHRAMRLDRSELAGICSAIIDIRNELCNEHFHNATHRYSRPNSRDDRH
ncbi:hypothetical protein [Nocardia sp. NPDC051463]|uniref:hypothetical protein n=1 Tax=Nocardia sp. NPDC051463 TaxID=3154845 RepID=UPI0034300FB8